MFPANSVKELAITIKLKILPLNPSENGKNLPPDQIDFRLAWQEISSEKVSTKAGHSLFEPGLAKISGEL